MRNGLKTILTVSLILSSACAIAATRYKDKNTMFKDAAINVAPKLLDGVYIGAQLGYDAYNVNADATGIGGNSANYDYYTKGLVGGLMVGYGQYLYNGVYLGGEIFGNYSLASENDSFRLASINGVPGFYKGSTTVDASGGIAFLPGYKLSDTTLGYLRLGWSVVGVKFEESASTIGSVGKHETVSGIAVGLGMETLLVDNLSVRAEYTYTDYGSMNASMGAGSSTSVDWSDNQFMLGLLYHLG